MLSMKNIAKSHHKSKHATWQSQPIQTLENIYGIHHVMSATGEILECILKLFNLPKNACKKDEIINEYLTDEDEFSNNSDDDDDNEGDQEDEME